MKKILFFVVFCLFVFTLSVKAQEQQRLELGLRNVEDLYTVGDSVFLLQAHSGQMILLNSENYVFTNSVEYIEVGTMVLPEFPQVRWKVMKPIEDE